ncbi:MAG TPA: acyl carrier protein [Clostridia bacterium]|nr:acyl carrier protein [Clostridia bacterium]
MLEKVKKVIAEQLGVDESKITESTSLVNDLKADSLDIAALVLDLEEQYDIEIPDEALGKLTTVGAIAQYIESHINK